ncbi:NrfD/PsrC family molybdoenzyme membrane anchor subunit [Campylobacter mucosalis]|uniref:Reductase-associated membrane protein n=1 Tax=Campylobacter mucosalis CCUG 21559 TaxID=1032067 RepID=A0A6G5QDZ8_9BACT|nr:NrfD/PsrC family molybdoenzyme membrane anchor subunit [Campylobacter mucosalis]QCD43905.1 reductase-associated membrane protein [Campylobacter mucosalis CCUG 21559]
MLQNTWGWLIVVYLFLGGLGAGAFVASALAYKGVFGKINERFYKFGFLLAPVAVVIGTALLLFDLAPSAAINPLKIINLYTEPTSMMSIGTYLLTFFIIVSALVYFKALKEGKICDHMLMLGIVLAFGVMGYTGLLLYVVKAIPLWASIWVPVIFVISALSTGISANAIVTLNAGHSLTHSVHKFHTILVAFEIFAIIMLFGMVSSEAAGFASIKHITAGSLAFVFWIGFVGLGLLVPLLGGANLFLNRACATSDGSVCQVEAKGSVASEICVLVGGFCLRAFMIFGAFYIF